MGKGGRKRITKVRDNFQQFVKWSSQKQKKKKKGHQSTSGHLCSHLTKQLNKLVNSVCTVINTLNAYPRLKKNSTRQQQQKQSNKIHKCEVLSNIPRRLITLIQLTPDLNLKLKINLFTPGKILHFEEVPMSDTGPVMCPWFYTVTCKQLQCIGTGYWGCLKCK